MSYLSTPTSSAFVGHIKHRKAVISNNNNNDIVYIENNIQADTHSSSTNYKYIEKLHITSDDNIFVFQNPIKISLHNIPTEVCIDIDTTKFSPKTGNKFELQLFCEDIDDIEGKDKYIFEMNIQNKKKIIQSNKYIQSFVYNGEKYIMVGTD